MMPGQLPESAFALRRERQQNLAAVGVSTVAAHVSSGLKAVDEFHRTVVADLHLVGEFSDTRPNSCGHSFDGQQELVLAMFETGVFHGPFAEAEELPNLKAKRRQSLVVGKSELPHAPIVSCRDLVANQLCRSAALSSSGAKSEV